jgi:hypothetical protein
MFAVDFISGTLTAFLSLMTYDLLGNEITAEKVGWQYQS